MPQCTMVTEYNEFHGNNDNDNCYLQITASTNRNYGVCLTKEEIDSLYLFLINNYSHILSHYWKDGFKSVKETT